MVFPKGAGHGDLPAKEREQTLAAMAVSWLLADSRVTSVIIGASSTAQIDANLRALDARPFSPDEMRLITDISQKESIQF